MKTTLCLCVVAASLAGCAGLIAPFVNNKYAGTYDGTFTTTDGMVGTATIQMTKIGNIFGTLKNNANGATGSLTGSVNTNLNYSGNVSFNKSSHSLAGAFNSSDGKVWGTLKNANGYAMTISIIDRAGQSGSTAGTTSGSTPTGSDNPFKGTWVAKNGDKAIIAADGTLTATVKDPTSGTDTFTGSITTSGAIVCTGTNTLLGPTVEVTGAGEAAISGTTFDANMAITANAKTVTDVEMFTKQ